MILDFCYINYFKDWNTCETYFQKWDIRFYEIIICEFWLFAASEPSAPRGQSRGDTPPETTMSDENDDEFEDNMNQMVHIYIVFHFPGASVHQRILLAIICFPS